MQYNIYIGFDPREQDAYNVAEFSLRRHASVDVKIIPLKLNGLHATGFLTRPVERRGNQLWCPISEAPMSTEFAISRFVVPFLQDSGWALFIDCDMLFTADIKELFDLADERYAIMVVKHEQVIREATKMNGVVQTSYNKKNWSSVCLWNLNHPSNKKLTREMVNTLPGRALHQFCWLSEEEIGALPETWNRLVVDDSVKAADAKLIHLTLGGPWFKHWTPVNSEIEALWQTEYDSFLRA